MPVMSGEKAMIKLKENPEFKTPVIALTADAIVGAEEPFNREQIKEKLDMIFKSE